MPENDKSETPKQTPKHTPKHNNNQFQWNGKIYSIVSLESQDKETLQKENLTSIVFGKVMNPNNIFLSWVYSIKIPQPPVILVKIENSYIKLFPFTKKEGIGMDRIELTYTQFAKEILAIKNYENEKPVNDKEQIQESMQRKRSSLSTYINETKAIRQIPSKRSFRSYYLEALENGKMTLGY